MNSPIAEKSQVHYINLFFTYWSSPLLILVAQFKSAIYYRDDKTIVLTWWSYSTRVCVCDFSKIEYLQSALQICGWLLCPVGVPMDIK